MGKPEVLTGIKAAEDSWLVPCRYTVNCFGLGEFPHRRSANPLIAGSTIIDPGADYFQLIKSLHALGLEITSFDTVLLTHLHYDHAAAVEKLRHDILRQGGKLKVFGPPGSRELAAAADRKLTGNIYYPGSPRLSVIIDEELPEGVEIATGEVTITGFLTSGHTYPHMSYLVIDHADHHYRLLASGDSLGGLIDPCTGSCLEEYYESCLKSAALVADGIHEGHGYPGHLLQPWELESRIAETSITWEDLRPGSFPDTFFPHPVIAQLAHP